jgi:hypothetical protein
MLKIRIGGEPTQRPFAGVDSLSVKGLHMPGK